MAWLTRVTICYENGLGVSGFSPVLPSLPSRAPGFQRKLLLGSHPAW
nr:MAG TPA: hypothetical protein [Caudoviricetes sp.]